MLVSADTLRGRRRENQDHVLAGNLLLSGGLSLHAAAPPQEPGLLAAERGKGTVRHDSGAGQCAAAIAAAKLPYALIGRLRGL